MNTNGLNLQQSDLSVQAPFGTIDVGQQLPAEATVQFIDLYGATIQKEDGSTFDMTFDSPLRFAPGSHFAQEYHSSDYRLTDKKIEASFDTAIGVSLSQDGRTLTAVFELNAKGESDERAGYSSAALKFKVHHSTQAMFGNMQLPNNLPSYINREPIRAARVVALHPHPTMGGFTQVMTSPPVEDVRISNLYRASNHVQNGGYMLFHTDGNLTYMAAPEFEALYSLVDNGVQQTLDSPMDTDRATADLSSEQRPAGETPSRDFPPPPLMKEQAALQH